jgi:hypothetical protein
LGDRGGQVLTQFGPGYDFSRLFSATDSNPAVPVWQNQVSHLTFNQRSASADETDTYVTLHDQDITAGTRRLFLRKFRSSSSAPEWTFELPTITTTHDLFDVTVSSDGSRIVAATVNPGTASVDVYVLGPDSPVPLVTTSVSLFGFMHGMDLTADGSRLLLASALYAKVIDTADGSEVGSVALLQSPLSMAISGDGDTIAFGNQNSLSVLAMTDDGSYQPAFNHVVSGTWFCRGVDISANSATLACGFVGYGSGRGIRVLAFDLDRSLADGAGVETMRYDATTTGQYSNGVSEIEISADGEVIAAGMWGDELGLMPEVMVFNSHQNAPTHTHNLPGSAQAIDLSSDGKRLAVASKSVHNNAVGGGGRLDLYDLEVGDLSVHGVPQAGNSVRIELEGNPGSPARLLVSRKLAKSASEHPGVGLLHLNRKAAWPISMGNFDANGVASLDYVLPTSVGHTLYFQGMQEGPKKLSEAWVKVTVLP